MISSIDGKTPNFQGNLKRRFLIAGTFSFPEKGGSSARATHMQAKGLAELGHEVTVATSQGTLPPNQTQLDGFRVVSFEGRGRKGRSARRGSWPWAKAQLNLLLYLITAVVHGRFDYILFYGAAPIFVPISLVGTLLNRSTCLIQYDLIKMRKDIPRYCAHVEKILAKRAKCIIATGSSLLIEHFKRIAPIVPVIHTWPPTDVHFYSNGNPAIPRAKYNFLDKKVIVYAGALNNLEGIDILLTAMKTLVERSRNVLLALAGRVAEADPIHGKPFDCLGMVNNLGLSDRVVLTGFLSMGEVADLLCSADILVNPKIDHILNRVAAPIKMGEYLAASRPVVSTRVCGLESWLRDGQEALFCDPGNSQQLCACIEELIDNTALAERIAQGGYLVAKMKCHYTAWASEVSRMLGSM